MIKVLLVIFSSTNGGDNVPTIIPMDSMDSCVVARTILLDKYDVTKRNFWGTTGPRWSLTDERIDCVDIGSK